MARISEKVAPVASPLLPPVTPGIVPAISISVPSELKRLSVVRVVEIAVWVVGNRTWVIEVLLQCDRIGERWDRSRVGGREEMRLSEADVC